MVLDWNTRLAPAIERWRAYLYLHPDAKGTMDFESRSTCDLTKRGAWLYSKNPGTEVMCLAYKLPCYDDPDLWHRSHPEHLIAESGPPVDLFAFVLAGGPVEAHNAFFERCIWKNAMVTGYGWPEVPHLQWRCSAAKASAASLPRKLEDAVLAMGLPIEKDMEGNALMRKMMRPRKMLKAEVELWADMTGWKGRLPGRDNPVLPVVWHETEEDIYRQWEYCRQDVRAEEGLSDAVPDLIPGELALWQLDQKMNERGARFDLELARTALDLADRWKANLNRELEVMTGISAASKRQQVKAWLLEHEDIDLPDTKADTLDWCLENWSDQFTGRARRIVYILKEVNRTSTRKYQDMLNKADDDWRVRDLLMFHGAHSGRWTGKGVQIHNFPRGTLKDMDEACADILADSVEWLEVMYGSDLMEMLSHALRGTAVSSPGYDLIVADYAAIEARCVLWEAGAQSALDVFRRGEDIYCDMATGVYGYTVLKKTHPKERQFGKQAILGLGYGMGFLTFLLTCRRYNIHFSRADALRIMGPEALAKNEAWVRDYLCLDGRPANMDPEQAERYRRKRRNASKVRRRLVEAREDPKAITHELALMKHVVGVYRARYPEVKELWKDQEAAAIKAVRAWESIVKAAKKKALKAIPIEDTPFGPMRMVPFSAMEHETTAWRDRFEGPRVECGKVTWYVKGGWLYGELPSGRPMMYRDPEIKLVKTSWGEARPALRYMAVDGKTKKWKRTATYGGKVVENITQAIARDILANAMLLADEHPTYEPVFHVHDELVCEVLEGEGSIAEFEGLMATVPFWAHDCPITAEAERYKRWRKG